MITLGYILFSYAGSETFMGGIWEATQDPDTFLFGKELNAQVADFKARVEKFCVIPNMLHLPIAVRWR
jgi:hypothetical protein